MELKFKMFEIFGIIITTRKQIENSKVGFDIKELTDILKKFRERKDAERECLEYMENIEKPTYSLPFEPKESIGNIVTD